MPFSVAVVDVMELVAPVAAAGAAGNFDVPAVLGFALLTAVIVVLISTVTDLLYGVVDPRVRFD